MSQATQRKIGDIMEDGTIYAGVSPSTGRDLFVMPQDSKPTHLSVAEHLGDTFNAHSYSDWRLPTPREAVHLLFANRAAIGNFDESGEMFTGWYWTASLPESPSSASIISAGFLSMAQPSATYPAPAEKDLVLISGPTSVNFGNGGIYNHVSSVDCAVRLVRG